jgi:hypothetical protein
MWNAGIRSNLTPIEKWEIIVQKALNKINKNENKKANWAGALRKTKDL